MSYIEIYNETLKDLLDPDRPPQIREHVEKGVYLDCTDYTITDMKQIDNLIQLGESNRHIGATKMNERSSRSHTIFRIEIESKSQDINDERTLGAILNIVDLAGSENAKNTEAKGDRLVEAGCINKSLSTLSLVISQLASNNVGHINFRDSKLTRLLQPSLNGNTRTSIIACISPASSNRMESEGTLKFACRAKNIVTVVKQNSGYSDNIKDIAILKREKYDLKLQIAEYVSSVNDLNDKITKYEEIDRLYNNILEYISKNYEPRILQYIENINDDIVVEENENVNIIVYIIYYYYY